MGVGNTDVVDEDADRETLHSIRDLGENRIRVFLSEINYEARHRDWARSDQF